MMLRLIVVLVVPVAIGQLLRIPPMLRRVASEHKIFLGVAARLLTVAVMLKAAVEVRRRFDGEQSALGVGMLMLLGVICVAVHLLALVTGYYTSQLIGFDRSRRIAVAIGGSQKTLPVSLILFDAYFTAYPLAVIPMVFFHFGQLI